MRHLALLRKPQPGQRVIHIENRHGADRAIAQSEILRGRVDDHTLRPTHFFGGLLRLGQVTTANQQRHLGMGRAQGLGRAMADGAGTAHEQNWMH